MGYIKVQDGELRDLEGSSSDLFEVSLSVCLEGLRITTKIIGQNINARI